MREFIFSCEYPSPRNNASVSNYNISIQQFDASRIKTDPKVVEYYKSIGWLSHGKDKSEVDDVIPTTLEEVSKMFSKRHSDSAIVARMDQVRKNEKVKLKCKYEVYFS
jgi:hypothetical protein